MREYGKTNEYTPEQYQTGRTRPPKSYGGLIAFLLMLVIFLSGIVSILGLMNIQLFRMVENQNSQDISLHSRSAAADIPTGEAAAYDFRQSTLGITGQEISDFVQHYYSLPQGIYITQVETDSDCYAKGLRSGDILLNFNDTPIPDSETLKTLLLDTAPGDSVTLTFYRSGKLHEVIVMMGHLEQKEE